MIEDVSTHAYQAYNVLHKELFTSYFADYKERFISDGLLEIGPLTIWLVNVQSVV